MPKLYNVIYAEHLLSYWGSGIWYLLGRGWLCDQPPIKTLGTDSNELPWWMTFHMLSQFCWMKCVLCDYTGKGLLCLVSSWFHSMLYSHCWSCLVSLSCNNSQPWGQLHAEFYEVFLVIIKVGIVQKTSDTSINSLSWLASPNIYPLVLKELHIPIF